MSEIYAVTERVYPAEYNYFHTFEGVAVYDTYEKAVDCLKKEAKYILKEDIQRELDIKLSKSELNADLLSDHISEDEGLFKWSYYSHEQDDYWMLEVENPDRYEDDEYIIYALIQITKVELNNKETIRTAYLWL